MTDLEALVSAFHADEAAHVAVLVVVQQHARAVAAVEPTTLMLALKQFNLSERDALRLVWDPAFPNDLDVFLTGVLRRIDFKTRSLFPKANAYIEGTVPGGLLVHLLALLAGGPLSAILGRWLHDRAAQKEGRAPGVVGE